MTPIEGPVHLIGVGGVHMSAIGLLLLEQGVAVTGSDLRASRLTDKVVAAGGRVTIGEHSAANVGDDTRLVVTTAAAGDDNPEIVEGRSRGIPVILRAEMVARLMEGKRVIAVAGAHGKTTTSSLIAFILREAGLRPMYLLGGESIDLDGHAAWGEGELCVVEADEYKRAFLEYSPSVAVVTNVEPDHLDYYGTEAAYHEAFVDFARRIVPGGRLVACWDDPGARAVSEAVEDQPISVETYGIDGARFWQAAEIRALPEGLRFNIRRGGGVLGELRSQRLFGDHVVRNFTAATAVCVGLGVPFEIAAVAVSRFRGAHRRFELTGEAHGITVMDDYAHHPTEVAATIRAARAAFPERRLIVVYQPHTYSRIAYLWDEWTRCWAGVDELIVLETYAARERPEAGRSAADLAAAIAPPARYARDFDEAARMAVDLAQPGDVVFTMGAGDVIEVGPRILEQLQ